MRSATTAASHHVDQLLSPPPPLPGLPSTEDPLVPRPMPTARNGTQPQQDETEVSLEEAQEALDAPYAHANPRSGNTLRRAATAAAVNRRRNPEPPVAGPVPYRRADGRAEHPHESDADNWVPPPPPYTKEVDPSDLPAFLRHTAISGVPIGQPFNVPQPPSHQPPPPPFTSHRPELPRLQTSPTRGLRNRTSWHPHGPHQRIASDSTSISRPSTSEVNLERPMTSPSLHSNRQEYEEDIYDATPPRSPRTTHQPRAMRTPERPNPQQTSAEETSAGAASAVESTPISSDSYRTMERLAEDPVEDPGYTNALASSLPPQEEMDDLRQNGDHVKMSPSIRRLSNAQTWPRAPPEPRVAPASTSAAADEYPRSAPPTTAKIDEMMAASLPPLPLPHQLASLEHRQEGSPPPRRASGVFQAPRTRTSGGYARNDEGRAAYRHSVAVPGLSPPPPPTAVPDLPLIISTPRGVSGVYDGPDQRPPGPYQRHHFAGTSEPVLHAPVPRHPRPATTSAILRPNGDGDNDATGLSLTPSQPLTASALRHHTSLSRRQSRARRSAAKNILDAKTRGWTGRKKNKEQQRRDGPDGEGAAAGGWTDVSLPPGGSIATLSKKRCVVM